MFQSSVPVQCSSLGFQSLRPSSSPLHPHPYTPSPIMAAYVGASTPSQFSVSFECSASVFQFSCSVEFSISMFQLSCPVGFSSSQFRCSVEFPRFFSNSVCPSSCPVLCSSLFPKSVFQLRFLVECSSSVSRFSFLSYNFPMHCFSLVSQPSVPVQCSNVVVQLSFPVQCSSLVVHPSFPFQFCNLVVQESDTRRM